MSDDEEQIVEELPHHHGNQDELAEIKKHAQAIIGSILAALIIVGGFYYYRSQKSNQVSEASERLLQANSLEQLKTISEEFANTPSAPFALLAEGSGHFNSGRYQQALEAYERLFSEHEGHPAAEIAEYLHALGQEASGSLTAALGAFQDLTEKQKDTYLYVPSLFGQARCLLQSGQMNSARNIYEEFIAAFPDSDWIGEAEFGLKESERKIRLLAAAPAAGLGTNPEVQIPFALPGQ